MKKYVLDANCFIDYFNKDAPDYVDIVQIFESAKLGKIEIAVSKHTLSELSQKKDVAYFLAESCYVVKHWPIGGWNDQVVLWNELSGSWDDGKRNNQVQHYLKKLANKGNSLRDRGAFLDALFSNYDGFVTSDKQLIKEVPQQEINRVFSTKVLKPEEVVF